jgi:hypothetical protein
MEIQVDKILVVFYQNQWRNKFSLCTPGSEGWPINGTHTFEKQKCMGTRKKKTKNKHFSSLRKKKIGVRDTNLWL